MTWLRTHAAFKELTRAEVVACAWVAASVLVVTLTTTTAVGRVLPMLIARTSDVGSMSGAFALGLTLLATAFGSPLRVSMTGRGEGWIELAPLELLVIPSIACLVAARVAARRGRRETDLPRGVVTGGMIGVVLGALMVAAPLSARSILTVDYVQQESNQPLPQVSVDILPAVLGAVVWFGLLAYIGTLASRRRRAQDAEDGQPSTWRAHLRTGFGLAMAPLVATVVWLAVVAVGATAIGRSQDDASWWFEGAMRGDFGPFDEPRMHFLLNFLVAAAGLGLGGTGRYALWNDAGDTGNTGWDYSYTAPDGIGAGLLAGHLPTIVSVTGALAAVLAATYVGVRAAARYEPGRPPLQRLWQPLIVMAGLWLVLIRVTGARGEMTYGLDAEPVHVELAAGLSWPSTVLFAALWSTIGLVCGAWLLRRIAGWRPQAAARVGGRHLHPQWRILLADAALRRRQVPGRRLAGAAADLRAGRITPPSTPLPDGRRDRLVVYALAGGAALIALGTAGIWYGRNVVYTPRNAAVAYDEALQRGDVEALRETVVPGALDRADQKLLPKSGQTPLPAVKLEDGGAAIGDGLSFHQVFATWGGWRSEQQGIHVSRTGSILGVFDEWKVDNPLRTLDVGTAGDGRKATVNGIAVDSGPHLVLQGVYKVSTDKQQPLTVNTALDIAGEPIFGVPATGADRDRASAAVSEYVHECAERVEAQPQGCPFSAEGSSGGGWSLESSPAWSIDYGWHGLEASPGGKGIARWTPTDEWDGSGGDAEFDVRGELRWRDGKVVFVPGE